MVKSTQQLIAAQISSVKQILDTYSNSSPAELNASLSTGSGGSSSSSGSGGTGKKKIVRRRPIVRRKR